MNRKLMDKIENELFYTVFDETLSVLIVSACNKQIPKEPIEDSNGNLICSNCKEKVDNTQRYCSKCGQRLKEVLND